MNRYTDWLRRKADHIDGLTYPDPRDDKLRDRGIELLWRARVQANEQRRQERT